MDGRSGRRVGGRAGGPKDGALGRQVVLHNVVKSWKGGWLGGSGPDFHTPKLLMFKLLKTNYLVLNAEVKEHTCMHA